MELSENVGRSEVLGLESVMTLHTNNKFSDDVKFTTQDLVQSILQQALLPSPGAAQEQPSQI